MTRAEVAAAYDARAEEYVEKLGSLSQMAPQDRSTIATWRDATTGRLLDAGSGPGHWTDVLSDGGRREVLGVDGTPRFAASARQRFPHLHLAVADLAALPVATASVGGVLAWFSVIHTPPASVPATLSELARVLAPGGSLLLGFFDGEAGVPFEHTVLTAYHWSADALGVLLAEAGFVVERTASRQDPGARRQGELVARRASSGS
ncbi:class I SAM-dependent methyltransferase [Nocardioides aurantiacus]|uniref:Methyltransferase family protein n=1 Tax=Nocardioides aurantiacus TaxID=86796 RepID=A0A3N2CWU8_9ACTN|nr:class I SAM-dependent methyltransferase [Nocardioides aurantiacus]ROR91959.1 methyltransferase family protein [Nocardioides aurantiacus]